jgi:ABC-type uncharacterized transport system permease subunit
LRRVNARVYLFLTLGFYAVGAIHVLLQAMTRRKLLSSWIVITSLAGFALHTASLSQRWTETGRFPALGLHDGTSFLAWIIVLVFLALYLRTRVDAIGLVLYPAAFLLVMVASLASPASPRDATVLNSVFLPVHISLAAAGYVALLVAGSMGALYLFQERELKARTPNRFYYVLPSLERADTIGGRSALVGFALLTLAILTGILWNHSVRGRYWTGDAKEWSATVAWLIYVALIWARHRSGWGGRRAAILGILGFLMVVFTFLWATLTTFQYLSHS